MSTLCQTSSRNIQITPLIKPINKNDHQKFILLQALKSLDLCYFNTNLNQMLTILLNSKTIKIDSGPFISYLWDIINIRKEMMEKTKQKFKNFIDQQLKNYLIQNFNINAQIQSTMIKLQQRKFQYSLEIKKHFLYYLIPKLKQFQILQSSEKMKRVNAFRKQTNFVNLQIKELNDGNLLFIRKLNEIQSQTQNRIYGDELIQNFCQYSSQQWNKINDKLMRFLLKYYQGFKREYNFYPPKMRKKFIQFHKNSTQFSVNPQYLILWATGMIQQPLSLEQLYSTVKTLQTFSDPLIYFRQIKKQQNKKLSKLLEKVFEKQFFDDWSRANGKVQSMAGAKSESELISSKLQELQRQSKQKNWKSLDEFIAIYNYLMLIYQFNNGFPFEIEKWRTITGQKKLHPSETQTKTYSDHKIQLIIQCYKNKEIFWNLLLISLSQNNQNKKMKQNIYVEELFNKKYLNFNYLQYNLLPKSKQQLKKQYSQKYQKPIKQRCTIYLTLIRNLSFPQSALLLASHNAVRYILISFLTFMFEVDLTNFSQIMYQEEILQLSEHIQNCPQISQVKKKIEKFRQKSYDKLIYYKNNPFQMVQNHKIVTFKAKRSMEYLEELQLTWKYKNNIEKLKERQKIQKVLQHFLIEHLFQRRTFRFKQMQIQFEHRENAPAKVGPQIKRFFFQAILLNYGFLQIFNITTIWKLQQDYTLNDKKIKLALMKIIDRRISSSRLIDFQDLFKMNIQTLTKQISVIGCYCLNPLLQKLEMHPVSEQLQENSFFGQKSLLMIKQTIITYKSLKQQHSWKQILFQLQKLESQQFLKKLKQQEQGQVNILQSYSSKFMQLFNEVNLNQFTQQDKDQFQMERIKFLTKQQMQMQKQQEQIELRTAISQMIEIHESQTQVANNQKNIIKDLSNEFSSDLFKICVSIQLLANYIVWSESSFLIILHNAYRYIALTFNTFIPKICEKMQKDMISQILKKLKINNFEAQVQDKNVKKKIKKIKLYQDKAASKFVQINASNQQRNKTNKEIMKKETQIMKKIETFQNQLNISSKANKLGHFLKDNLLELVKLISKHLYRKETFKNKQSQIVYSLNKHQRNRNNQQNRQVQQNYEQKSNFRKQEIRKLIIEIFKFNYFLLEIILGSHFFHQRVKKQLKNFKQSQQITLIENFQTQQDKILWNFFQMIKELNQKIIQQEKELKNLQRREKNKKYINLYNFVVKQCKKLQEEYQHIKSNRERKVFSNSIMDQRPVLDQLQKSQEHNASIFGFKLSSRMLIMTKVGMRQNYLRFEEWPQDNYQLDQGQLLSNEPIRGQRIRRL